MSTRHLRPWHAKRKMSVRDTSQKVGRNMYLQGSYAIVQHRKMHRRAQNVAKITTLQEEHALHTFVFNLSKQFYVFLMRQTLGRQTIAKYLRNA